MERTIVIVDDFENTRWIVEFTIKKLQGIETLIAVNGQEAFKFFDGRKIDLLVTDYNMPVIDGLQLVKKVREIGAYQFIPIIMLTTETDTKKKEHAKEAKITAWVQKPFKTDEFLSVVKKSLRIRD